REVNAIAARDLEVRGERCFGGLVRRVAGRDTLREPVGEGAERIERLDAGRAAQRFDGCGLEVGRGQADAERLAARRLARERDQRQQRGRIRRAEAAATDLAGADEAAALADGVPDLEVVQALAAHF